MFFQKVAISSLASLGIILGINSNEALAQINHEIPSENSQTTQFRQIEQPIWIKGAVTAGGLALIGLELWWFLLSKPKSQKAEAQQGIQEITVTVDGGYEPSYIIVNAGQQVRLNFLRRDPSSCLEEVKLPDFHIVKNLPLNQITPIDFKPNEPGIYTFTCGMNMFRGTIEVQGTEATPQKISTSTIGAKKSTVRHL
ncbi:MAG: cupredoxin domain-containing protein [Scytonema sp. PMC 1069.18]|nr:cupredoxin domain-containing protein [Scytonema sp. PMC 1069.18]MEC4884463.1 cupredoxin domain-containing protein [Scytonema sp. PMC 1070.18]